MSGGRAPGKNVAFNKPQEPAFLKAFKAKVGYKEPAVTIDSKREAIKPSYGDDEPGERDDELPTVVVLKAGDVGQEEFLEYRERTKDQTQEEKSESSIAVTEQDKKDSESGRIMFKKPTKRMSEEGAVLDATTSKKSKQSSHSNVSGGPKAHKTKVVKNKKLLSFGQEYDEELT